MGPREILILLLIALLLFGASRLPQLARSLGRSARILKSEAKGLQDDDDDPEGEKKQAAQAEEPRSAQGDARASRRDDHQGYPQLPPGQRIVDESGEPTRRGYGDRI